MIDMVSNPGMANYFMGKFTDFYHEYYRRIFQAAAKKIDAFAMADDFGMQNNLFISPQMFDDYVTPRLESFLIWYNSS